MLITFNSFQSLFVFIIIFLFLSCEEKDEISYNLKGRPYPRGVKTIDLQAINDCTLPWCSHQRVSRLELNDVSGYLRLDSILQITFTFDSSIEFHICNKDEIDFNFKMEEF
jgi:hypothetical protein